MKYIICGNYGVQNVGDDCILLGIQNLIKEKDPEARISVMGKGLLLPFGFRSFFKGIFFLNLWRKPLQAIRNADIFVLGGGGLFTDEERAFTGAFWALHAIAALLLNKRVVILGVSIGPMNFISAFLVRFVLRRATYIYVRDEYSVKMAHHWKILKTQLCPDMAIFIDWNSFKKQDITNNNKYVLLILRNYKNINKNTINNFVRLIEYIYSKYGLKSIITDFIHRQNKNSNIMHKKIIQKANSSTLSVHNITNNIDDLHGLLLNARLVISMRYHGGIISLLNSVPFISINYMTKSSNTWSKFDSIKTISLTDFSKKDLNLSFIDSVLDDSKYIDKILIAKREYTNFSKIFAQNFQI